MGNFLEASTGRIELKDDDPQTFHKLLSYLYREDYEPYIFHASIPFTENCPYARSGVPERTIRLDDKHAMDSAKVYIMADKYQLDCLKKVAVGKIKALELISHQTFLELSAWIYAAVPEEDRIFRNFFIQFASVHLMATSEAELAPYIAQGGPMAEDMVFALRAHIVATEYGRTAKVS